MPKSCTHTQTHIPTLIETPNYSLAECSCNLTKSLKYLSKCRKKLDNSHHFVKHKDTHCEQDAEEEEAEEEVEVE